MNYPDLSQIRPGIFAVGWLEPGSPFTKGLVEKRLFEKLVELFNNPWQKAVIAGVDRCSFCRFTRHPVSAVVLTIPGDACLFQSPGLVAHYIDAHEYSPPQAFIKAVLDCAPMRSMDYLNALRKNSPDGFFGA